MTVHNMILIALIKPTLLKLILDTVTKCIAGCMTTNGYSAKLLSTEVNINLCQSVCGDVINIGINKTAVSHNENYIKNPILYCIFTDFEKLRFKFKHMVPYKIHHWFNDIHFYLIYHFSSFFSQVCILKYDN